MHVKHTPTCLILCLKYYRFTKYDVLSAITLKMTTTTKIIIYSCSFSISSSLFFLQGYFYFTTSLIKIFYCLPAVFLSWCWVTTQTWLQEPFVMGCSSVGWFTTFFFSSIKVKSIIIYCLHIPDIFIIMVDWIFKALLLALKALLHHTKYSFTPQSDW